MLPQVRFVDEPCRRWYTDVWKCRCIHAALTQSVEYLLGKEEVGGSSPLGSSKRLEFERFSRTRYFVKVVHSFSSRSAFLHVTTSALSAFSILGAIRENFREIPPIFSSEVFHNSVVNSARFVLSNGRISVLLQILIYLVTCFPLQFLKTMCIEVHCRTCLCVTQIFRNTDNVNTQIV